MLIAVFAALTASLAPPPTTVSSEEPVVVRARAAMDDAEESLKKLQGEWDDAQAAHQKAMREASGEERAALRGKGPNAEDYTPRFLALAEKYARTDVAARALGWVAQNSRNAKVKRKALETLVDDHIESEVIGGLCGSLEGDYLDGAGLLGRILEESPHHDVKGNACLTLGLNLKQSAEIAEGLKAGMKDMYLGWGYGEEVVSVLSKADGAALAEAAVANLTRVGKEFADVKNRRRSLADTAKGDLFELQNLWFGMTAPEIEAEDIDGVTFKLSDYRGKVVALDFWGDW